MADCAVAVLAALVKNPGPAQLAFASADGIRLLVALLTHSGMLTDCLFVIYIVYRCICGKACFIPTGESCCATISVCC